MDTEGTSGLRARLRRYEEREKQLIGLLSKNDIEIKNFSLSSMDELNNIGISIGSGSKTADDGVARERPVSPTNAAGKPFLLPFDIRNQDLENSGDEDKYDYGHEESNININNQSVFENKSFIKSAIDRGTWLGGLLLFQSFSSVILSKYVDLIQKHPTIVYFLTALVGAGGNAGNQASVRCIRGLALKSLNQRTMKSFIKTELLMAVVLSGMLGIVGLLRAWFSNASPVEMLAIVISLITIVFVSVITGACLPLVLQLLGADPAHASTSIQVIMDISGVAITMMTTTLLVDSSFFDEVSHVLGYRDVSQSDGGMTWSGVM